MPVTLTLEKLCSLIQHCAKTKASRYGISLHAWTVKTGAKSNVYFGNHILNCYAKCGHIDSAQKVFNEMSERNLVTWSAMIAGYDQSKKPYSALGLFVEMRKYCCPTEHVLASALSSCASVKYLNLGKQIHAQALRFNLFSVSFVVNSMVLMYMKCEVFTDAFLVFNGSSSSSLTLVSYNVLITGLMENNQQEKGIRMFNTLCREGLVPDRFTFAGLLGCGKPLYHSSLCMLFHCQMLKLGFDKKGFSANVLITLYSNLNLVHETMKLFLSIEEKDSVSWNSIIAACCRCKDYNKALTVIREMITEDNVEPDNFTYASLLCISSGLSLLTLGKEIHAHLLKTRLHWDIGVGNALVNMYTKSGSLNASYTIFSKMEIRNLVSWNSIIAAFANHGLARKAIDLFEEMTRTNQKPDSLTFLELLRACNYSGLVNEAQVLLNSMNKDYGIYPNCEHLCCIINLLGRAGMLREAEECVRLYSLCNDEVALGSLLSACQLHGDNVVGERVAKKLLELKPRSTSPYVLLSNLYASDHRWDDVVGARNLMTYGGLRKEVAHSFM